MSSETIPEEPPVIEETEKTEATENETKKKTSSSFLHFASNFVSKVGQEVFPDQKEKARRQINKQSNNNIVTQEVVNKDGKVSHVRSIRTQSVEIVPGSHNKFIQACKEGNIKPYFKIKTKIIRHLLNSFK